MAKRDIIIAIFSDPGTATPEKKAIREMVYGSDWKNQPYVWNFPDDASVKNDKGIRSGGYESSARKFMAAAKAKGGTGILPLILNKIAENPMAPKEFGRIALVTFSAGNSAARFIMANPSDQAMLDTFISLDSTAFQINPQTKQPWELASEGQGWYQYPTFGMQGFDASAMSVFLHTNIINANPDIMSTKASAELVFAEMRKVRASMDSVRDTSIASPLDFVPAYPEELLNAGPHTRYWPAGSPAATVADRVGNNIRIWLPTNGTTQINGHIACCYDYQRAIFDTFLKPRWNNPEKFSCIGPECIKQFTPDPPLSGLAGWTAGMTRARGLGALTETAVVPTTKTVDMAELTATWSRLGLPRWDLLYGGAAAVGAAAVGAGLAYWALKD